MDIYNAIACLVPGAEFVGVPVCEESYKSMRWLDDRPKPTWAELQAVEVPDPVPEEVTRTQFVMALRARKIYETVRGAAELHSQELADFLEYSMAFTRHSEYLAIIWSLLEYDSETVDQIFIEAAGFLAS